MKDSNSFSINPNDVANAKPMTLGYALLDMFSRKITPKNIGDAAEIKKWHSRFYNKSITLKGIIELDSDELKEIKEIFDTQTDPKLLEVVIDGTMYNLMTDYLAEALIKKK